VTKKKKVNTAATWASSPTTNTSFATSDFRVTSFPTITTSSCSRLSRKRTSQRSGRSSWPSLSRRRKHSLSTVIRRPLLFHGWQPNYISLSLNARLHFSSLLSILILHKQSEQSEHSEVKGTKKGHKIFWPSLYGWEGMHLSVCVFVLIEKMKRCQR